LELKQACLLFDGIVILTLLTAPVNWIELEESESAAFAAGGADAGASSDLDDHWLDWDYVGGWTQEWRN